MHLLIIGVMISNLIVPERVEVPFQNHSTPYNSGGEYGYKGYSFSQAFMETK
jgi:hypothetical protein